MVDKSKMISIDVETLGISHASPIIQIGAVFFDIWHEPGTVMDTIIFDVRHDQYNNVEPFAAAMNQSILYRLAEKESKAIRVESAAPVLGIWISKNWRTDSKVVFCGKNFSSFDRPKLERLPGWFASVPVYHHRSPDPGSMWWRPKEDGAELPSTETCMKRAGISGEVTHDALEDAAMVAKLIQIWCQQ